jgi:hypothetical protein
MEQSSCGYVNCASGATLITDSIMVDWQDLRDTSKPITFITSKSGADSVREVQFSPLDHNLFASALDSGSIQVRNIMAPTPTYTHVAMHMLTTYRSIDVGLEIFGPWPIATIDFGTPRTGTDDCLASRRTQHSCQWWQRSFHQGSQRDTDK